jgi:hypothetical protein
MVTQTQNPTDRDRITPPTPARLVNPIHFYVGVFLYLTLAFVVLPLPLFAVSPAAGAWGELLGGVFGLSMLLSALITALVGWSVSRRLKRFQQGDYMVHWTYSREEWLTFAESEWEYRRAETRQAPRLGLLLGGFTGLICGGTAGYALFHAVLPVVLGALAGTLLLGLLGGLFGWLGGAATRWAHWRMYRWMRQRLGETYIGADAAYTDGCYWSWTAMNFELMGVELVAGPQAVLVFTLRVYMQKGYALYRYRTPVPQGREAEAQWVVQRLGGN